MKRFDCSILDFTGSSHKKNPRNITAENVTTGASVVRIEGNSQADLNDVMNKLALTNNKDNSNGKR